MPRPHPVAAAAAEAAEAVAARRRRQGPRSGAASAFLIAPRAPQPLPAVTTRPRRSGPRSGADEGWVCLPKARHRPGFRRACCKRPGIRPRQVAVAVAVAVAYPGVRSLSCGDCSAQMSWPWRWPAWRRPALRMRWPCQASWRACRSTS
eukprot:scaffold87485_cov52-Phaeocystis_antarctica.AAC.3